MLGNRPRLRFTDFHLILPFASGSSAAEAVAAWLKPRQLTVRESKEGLHIGVAGVRTEHAADVFEALGRMLRG